MVLLVMQSDGTLVHAVFANPSSGLSPLKKPLARDGELEKARLAQTIRHSREGGNPEPLTPEQIHWLEIIRDHIAANLSIDTEDFDYAPFAQEGGLGKVHQVFGEKLNKIIEELNGTLAA